MSSPEISVSGGAGGIEAELADLATLGHSSTGLAETLAVTSAACHGMLADPDLLASALLDPAGVARFDAALLEALDGPRGLTALAVRFTEQAVFLQGAAAAYQAADEALAGLADDLHAAEGVLLVGGALASPLTTLVAGAFIARDPQRWLTDHPGLVDDVVDALPVIGNVIDGLTDGATSPWLGGADVRSAARRLGQLWPDGTAVVQTLPDDRRAEVVRPPRGVADLLTALDFRNRASGPDSDQIDVRVITHADGTRAYIVDIPGTQDWSLPDGSVNPATNDLGTNVRVLGGDVTSRERAIAEALHRAGASSTDPVMLVGHSQGGMVAAQAAHDAGTPAFGYDVRTIVTAGSPIARAGVPASVQVLALENRHDIVPHLDGRGNDDAPNVTTVTFDQQNGTVATNHSISGGYSPAAAAVDRSDDPSIAAYRASAAPFLAETGDGTRVEAHVYAISRR
jgi:hypothetical protein